MRNTYRNPTANTEYRPIFCFIGLRNPLRITRGIMTAARSVAALRAEATGHVIVSAIHVYDFVYDGSYISQLAESGVHLARGIMVKTSM